MKYVILIVTAIILNCCHKLNLIAHREASFSYTDETVTIINYATGHNVSIIFSLKEWYKPCSKSAHEQQYTAELDI